MSPIPSSVSAGSRSLNAFGDAAVLVRFSGVSSDEVRQRIHGIMTHLTTDAKTAKLFAVPGFDSLTVHFDPLEQDPEQLLSELAAICELPSSLVTTARHVVVPVCYEPDCAPDLAELAAVRGMTCEDVIKLHSESRYTVQMIGFAPGFPYLAGLPTELHAARRSTPRITVPAGSVAIGGSQTGIYPTELPGGWHLIGRTPLRLFDPERDAPCLLNPGDHVTFCRIGFEEFRATTLRNETYEAT